MQGYIVVITRNGSLGGRYPLTSTECLFGQSPICDVRVYVANVARKHCLITALPNERAYIHNLSPSNTTLVNGIQIGTTQCELQHADVITVGDRHFRWEYPISDRQKTPARKTKDSEVHKTPTCMVQVPMSVFKKKRHSSPGVLRENKIISITSQDGVEPEAKRRKTLHSVTDLVMENKLVKPVNKQLMPVTQPAGNPKSFNTFKVLLKSASKRKSLIPISKTPKPQKKVISTKIHKSKSLSPQKLSPKQKNLQKYSKKSEQVLKLSIPSLNPVANKLSLSTPFCKSISTITKKTPSKNSQSGSPVEDKSPDRTPRGRPSKSPQASSTSKSSFLKTSQSDPPVKEKTTSRTPRGRPLKTPKISSATKSTPPVKFLSPKASRSSSPVMNEISRRIPRSRSKTPQASSSRKSVSPVKSPSSKTSQSGSPVEDKSPVRTPRGRPSKSPQASSTSKSVCPVESSKKTPRGRPPKTHAISSATKSTSPEKLLSPKTSRNSLPAMGETSGRTPRGRPKTPQASPTRKSVSPVKSSFLKTSRNGSPVKDKTPGKTPSGRPPKTPIISSAGKYTPDKLLSSKTSRISSPAMDETSGRTPRGRPKTPQASVTRKSISPVKSSFLKTSRSDPPMKEQTTSRTPRGRPVKTPKISSATKSTSPVKFLSPKASRSSSPIMDEISGRTPRSSSKTPQASSSRKSVSPVKSPSSKTSQSGSPVEDESPVRTPRGRPSKSPQASSTSKSVCPVESPKKTPQSSSPVKEKTPGRTPRGRPPKTPKISSATKSTSPVKFISPKAFQSSSSVMAETPGTTSRGRPSKMPQASPTRQSVSPAKSPSKVFGSSTLVKTPIITLRGRPFKTPQTSPTQSPTSGTAPVCGSEVETLVESSRSDVPLNNSFLREDNYFVKTPKAPKLNDKSPTGKLNTKRVQDSEISSPHQFLSTETVTSNYDSSIDQSFGRASNNETEALSNMTKSIRRSALRSGLSSSKDLTSLNKPLLLKSSIKKAEIVKLQIDSKRKYDTAAEAKAERAAKRLKMETPKSLTKNKKAALLVCHSPKSQKRPLFSEVLKSHLSTVKKNQASSAVHSVVAKRAVKQISCKQPLSLEVPKSFNFNSTGHANSPETIIIRKKIKKTPAPKTRKGRKSTSHKETGTIDNNLEGVLELYKTPKLILSSLKSGSSVKKSQNVRVRFSLQNDVQSPSGRRSLVMQSDEATYFGSPMVPSKKYIGTPRPPRGKLSDTSLIHTSIMEESPLAQEIDASEVHISPSETSDKSYDFSAYSPSSPTLQFSRISGVSSVFARRSIDFIDSPVSERSKESPKRKRSTRTPNDTLSESSLSSSKRFSFASVSSYRSRNSSDFQPSPDSCAIFSQSDLNVSSPVNSYLSQGSRSSRISITKDYIANVSQIPLPHSPLRRKSRLTSPTSSSLKYANSSNSVRSTRSSNTDLMSNTSSLIESPQIKKSKVQLPSSTETRITSPENSSSSQTFNKTNQSLNLSLSPSNNSTILDKLPKRISSTPRLSENSNIYSPISSPISMFHRRSLRSLDLPSPQNFLDESSKVTAITEDQTFKTPLPTPGKKPRRGCNRMNASNAEMLTPESQVPVAAVKPSTRRKQGNDSYSSASESVSLPAFSVSHDISGRSVDRNLAQKVMDSRASSGLDQSRTSRSTTPSLSVEDESNLSLGSLSSSRRKRKSSASTSIQSIDATTFDFTSAITPKIPREMFVSPLVKVSDDLTNISGVKRILSPKGNSPVSNYEDVRGIKRLLKTPKTQNDLTDVTGVKRVMNPKANSPISSYIDVKGVKGLLKTPQSHSPLANYASIEGIKGLFKHSPVADYTNVAGVKSLYSASVEPNYMNVKGVRRIFKETKVPNSPDIAGVEVLFESPKKIMDEFNQSSSSKPIGMVPPMSRQVSGIKTSGDLTTETVYYAVEGNQPVTRNAENTSSLRRRTLASQKLADKQLKSNTSVSLRKSKRTNADSQAMPKSAIQSLDSEKKNSRQINQANGKNVEELSTHRRITRIKRTQAPLLEGNEQEFTRDSPVMKTSTENEVGVSRKSECKQLTAKKSIKKQINPSEISTEPSVSNNLPDNTQKKKEVSQPITRSPKKENQELSLNTKPGVGRRTRQTLRQAKTESAEISRLSNKEESNVVKSSIKVNKNDKHQENPEATGRKTRGRSRSSPKQEGILEDSSSVPKSKVLSVQENVQSPANMKKTKVTGNENKIKGLDIAETQQDNQIATGSRRGKVNVTSNIDDSNEKTNTRSRKNIESESDAGAKRNVRSRGGKVNKEKATTPEPTVVPVGSPTYPENNIKERRGRGRPVKRKAQEVNSKSPEMSLGLSKTTSRKRKTNSSQGSANKLSLEQNKNLGKGDLGCNSEFSLSVPSTSQTSSLGQDDCKKTSRRVQFDMKSSSSPKKRSPKKRTAKKTVSDKAATSIMASKTESPTSSLSPKKRVPAKKVATKTKATPKLKAAAKTESPASLASPKKRVPAKKVARPTKTEATSKLKAAAKTESPASSASSKNRAPAKKVATKTKDSPKLKAAAKRKGSILVQSPAAKRITRSRK